MVRQAPLYALGFGLGFCLLLAGCREEAQPSGPTEIATAPDVPASARSLEEPARTWFAGLGARITDGPEGRADTFAIEVSPGLSEEDFDKLSRLTDLRSISLYRSGITDADLEQLPAWPNLAWLNLAGTKVALGNLELAGKFPA